MKLITKATEATEVPAGKNEPIEGVRVEYDDGSTGFLTTEEFDGLDEDAFAEDFEQE